MTCKTKVSKLQDVLTESTTHQVGELEQVREVGGVGVPQTEFGARARGALENGTLNLPDLGKLPRCQDPRLAPHVFVGDEAFQLRPDFLRPYPAKDLTGEKRVFNYQLSRGRILLRTINLIPQNVNYVVKAACVLHNYLLEHREHPEGYADGDDCFGNTTEGSWRAETTEA
ncbi:hypothetical protein HPB47_017379 [Ixodes persulcatus]|uniref:Uncharacterized protein n=1 Tax=Ixodes persulcatus TaxID=34615 RepID=A0AC60QQZ4_IXOPE|nr:hypothetical protein HPB47_017379 [Ixodes persulcatus]